MSSAPTFRECQGCGVTWDEPEPERHHPHCPFTNGHAKAPSEAAQNASTDAPESTT